MNEENIDKKDLFDQLFRAVWLLRRHHMGVQRSRGPHAAPHQGQGRVLALLKIKPQMSQRELATILDIRSQSLGELLAKLEKQGYLTRSPSESDKRVLDIQLTEAGRSFAEATEVTEEDEDLFGCLTEEERSHLSEFLDKLIASWEEAFGDDRQDFRNRPDFRGRGFGPPFGRDHNHEPEEFPPFRGHDHGRGHRR